MTDKEIGKILKGMTILVDTREKKNDHILEYFNSNGISWKIQKLSYGDYGVEFPDEYSHLNNCVVVEKKNGIDEINGNFTKKREQFHNEFRRANEAGSKIHLLIENATWKKIANGSYRSTIAPNSVIASILVFSNMYDAPVWFVGKDESPMLIYKLLWYGVRGKLKEIENKH